MKSLYFSLSFSCKRLILKSPTTKQVLQPLLRSVMIGVNSPVKFSMLALLLLPLGGTIDIENTYGCC